MCKYISVGFIYLLYHYLPLDQKQKRFDSYSSFSGSKTVSLQLTNEKQKKKLALHDVLILLPHNQNQKWSEKLLCPAGFCSIPIDRTRDASSASLPLSFLRLGAPVDQSSSELSRNSLGINHSDVTHDPCFNLCRYSGRFFGVKVK